jgi:hypothetical protein
MNYGKTRELTEFDDISLLVKEGRKGAFLVTVIPTERTVHASRSERLIIGCDARQAHDVLLEVHNGLAAAYLDMALLLVVSKLDVEQGPC